MAGTARDVMRPGEPVMDIEQRNEYVVLRVRVQPKASRNALRIEADGRIRISLTAPPVEGAANAALCAFTAKCLGLPKRAVSLHSGDASRDKSLRVDGLDARAVEEALRAHAG